MLSVRGVDVDRLKLQDDSPRDNVREVLRMRDVLRRNQGQVSASGSRRLSGSLTPLPSLRSCIAGRSERKVRGRLPWQIGHCS
jgi:hypothetical protein